MGLAWISIFGGMMAAALLCLPVIGLTLWLNLGDAGQDLPSAPPPPGTAYGALLTFGGLRLAAPRTAARLPEIVTAVSKG